MSAPRIENNESLLGEIKKTVLHGNIHHGYIIEGPATADKMAVALHFAKSILCGEYNLRDGECSCPVCRKIDGGNHLDVTAIHATVDEGRSVASIKNEGVDMLLGRLSTKPLEGDRNIGIICDGDTMGKHAMNRLLKSLEEPPLGTVIMILSENIYNLPETVRSRCIHFRVNPWKSVDESKAIGIAEDMVTLLLAGAPYYKVKKVIDSMNKKDRKEIFLILDAMEEIYREKLSEITGFAVRENIYSGVHRIEEAREEIKHNINSAYAMKKMALAIGGQ